MFVKKQAKWLNISFKDLFLLAAWDPLTGQMQPAGRMFETLVLDHEFIQVALVIRGRYVMSKYREY